MIPVLENEYITLLSNIQIATYNKSHMQVTISLMWKTWYELFKHSTILTYVVMKP
jgi:hypothetical protein